MHMQHHSSAARSSLIEYGPHRVIGIFLEHRRLIVRLVWRQVSSVYKGSVLGVAWTLINPLFMLMVYTFVFTVVFTVRWDIEIGSRAQFALVLYIGLIIVHFFNECLLRAPSLLLENVSYIKKVIFPLEILPWVLVGTALVNATFAMCILLAIHVIFVGLPPWTGLFFPLVVFPLILLVAGMVWAMSALGVFLRDIKQVVGVVATMLFFLSPLFYPVSALPERFQAIVYLNPLTFVIEQGRLVVLIGQAPDFAGIGAFFGAAVLVAWAGLAFFLRTKRAFADVV